MTSLSADLVAAGIPLSTEQLRDVAVGMFDYAEASWWAKGDTFAGVRSFTEPREVDPQTGLTAHGRALLKRYAPVLTPAQLHVIKDALIEETRWRQITQR